MSGNPLNLLPVEILEEILTLAVGPIEISLYPASSKPHNPWDLALVCKDWRNAVFSTPCIWSNISFWDNPRPQTDHCNNALLSVLKLCLDRSCSHPLTIKFTTCHKVLSNLISVVLTLLMEHVQRWETVTFKATHGTLLHRLSDYAVHYPRLRHVSIENMFEQPEEKWAGLFRDAPILSSISLNRISYHRRLGGVGIPWSQISDLQIYTHVGELDDLLDILRNASNVATLEYTTLYTRFNQVCYQKLELLHLKRLVWTTQYEEDKPGGPATTLFFDLLQAPQLSILEVSGVRGDRLWEAIRDCLQRSGCSTLAEASNACPVS